MHSTAFLMALFLALGATVTALISENLKSPEAAARAELSDRGVTLADSELLDAVRDGDRDTIRLLLKGGVSPNARDERGRTPLMLALRARMPDVAEDLIVFGARLDERDDEGHSVICHAVRHREPSIVQRLLARGVDPDTQIPGGGALSAEALTIGRTASAKLMLESGGSTEARDSQGVPMIFRATERGMDWLVQRLLNRGAKVEARDANGDSLLHAVVRTGRDRFLNLFLDHGADADMTNGKDETPLHLALNEGRWDLLAKFLDHGASADRAHPSGWKPLHRALVERDVSEVTVLLEHGADANSMTPEEWKPLHLALREQKISMVKVLLEHEADANARTPDGLNPLHLALQIGDVALVNVLLEFKADANARTPDGLLPLHLAMRNKDHSSVTALLEHGADPKAMGADGRPILEVAVDDNLESRFLAALLEHGAQADIEKRDGRSLLNVVLDRKDFESAQLFLDARVDPGNVLYNAVVEGDVDKFRFLMKNGADPNGGPSDDPVLVAAVRGAHREIVADLLQAGAGLDRPGREKQSALHLAVAINNTEITKLLLQNGADPNVPFAEPVTEEFIGRVREIGFIKWQFRKDSRIYPIMMAADSGNHDLTRVLIAHGAKKAVWTKRRTHYPIGFAARRDDVKMMQILLDRDPDATEERWIKVDLSQQRAWVYDSDGESIFTTKISSGKSGYRTKTGEFVITNRTRHHVSNIYKGAKMPYFQRLSCGDFGFHEGYVPGYPASHGCIRVPRGNASKLWKLTQAGDRVVIVP